MERPAPAPIGLSWARYPDVTQREWPSTTISVRPHKARPVTRTFLPASTSPSFVALSPGWVQTFRSSVVQRCCLACSTADLMAALDMKLEAYDVTGGATFCRSSERVTRSGRSAAPDDADDADATSAAVVRGLS